MHLDEEKLEALRSWGERLGQSRGEEYAAVGRAILMLVEEIDRLHIELWHARLQSKDGDAVSTVDTTDREEEAVSSSLHARLKHVLRRDSAADHAEEPAFDTTGSPTASAQAWIAALRREK